MSSHSPAQPSPRPILVQQTLAAQRHQRAEQEQSRIRAAEQARARAGTPASPQALGLECCPDCGFWRDPIPPVAQSSAAAFAGYLETARARCLCTSVRCSLCGETALPVPAPTRYDPEEGAIVRVGSWFAGWAHSTGCAGRAGKGKR